jgi:ferrochelatase
VNGDAVLLMAYGSPASLDDVPAYFAHIRGGRPATAEAVEALKERYRRIGGTSPLRRAPACGGSSTPADMPSRSPWG